MAIIAYLMVFSSFFSASILYFKPGLIEYKIFVLLICISFFLLFLYKLMKNNFKIYKNTLYVFLFSIVLIFLFLMTPIFYHKKNDLWTSFLLVVVAQTVPVMIAGNYIGHDDKVQSTIMKMAPIIALIFTFISYNSAVHPTLATSGGFAMNLNGLDYNSTSYMSALAGGLGQYYIVMYDDIEWASFLKKDIMKLFMIILNFVNLFSILLAGGRGGLVTFLVISLISFIILVSKNKLTVKTIFKYSCLIICLIIVILLVIKFAMTSNVSTSGFQRIINALQNGDSSGRNDIFNLGMSTFSKSPIVGHGIGSVFFEIERYSHNCFIDCLIETGIVGFIILITILIKVINHLKVLIRFNYCNYIWLIVFIFGFVESLFSGYYLAQLPVFFIGAMCWSLKVKGKGETI